MVGWVEYEGAFRFGFYPQPLLFDHGTARWHQPGGAPEWLEDNAKWTSRPPVWNGCLRFVSETTAQQFCRKVASAQEHIAAGNIYQVNLAHRLNASWPARGDAFALYLDLRKVSPAPQSAFLELAQGRTILCSSPEEFLVFQGPDVRTRPIKGTRPRGGSRQADLAAANDLVGSEKERAELLMITDLLRNDLGQFCDFGSVRVRELFKVEWFAQVIHLVSTIEGRLRAGVSHAAALQMCLPGGSITGAPKRRAREVIAELEAGPRGIYTGSIGVFLGREQSRFNIAIRTLVIERDQAYFHVGAGIVADSVPMREWEETLHKAAGILRAAAPAPSPPSPQRPRLAAAGALPPAGGLKAGAPAKGAVLPAVGAPLPAKAPVVVPLPPTVA